MLEKAGTLSVATYNIHRGVGRDRRLDHQRIAQAILEMDVDVVALQEVETPAAAAGSVALLHRLRLQGYEPVLGPTMRSAICSYGNALLSRLPISKHGRHDLSYPGREPRGLIEVSLSLDGVVGPGAGAQRQLACFATHLGLSVRERRQQIRRLIEQVDRQRHRSAEDSPMLLLGDFNEWRRCPRRLKPLAARLQLAPTRPTYPGGWPILPLDRIWFGGGLQLQSLDVIRTGAARTASDHLPLRACFALS